MGIRASGVRTEKSRALWVTYSIVALAACALGAFALWLWQRWDLYWMWLLSTNVIAFMFYRFDKWQSKHNPQSRVPNLTLMLLSLVGGFVGAALAMYMPERHKTGDKNKRFRLALLAGAAIQAVIIFFLYLR